jgi:hypothetical protein
VDLDFLSKKEFDEHEKQSCGVGKLVNGLIDYIRLPARRTLMTT